MSRKPTKYRVFAVYLTLTVLSIGFVLPFVWMVLTSLKAPHEIFDRILPSALHWSNYVEALTQPTLPFGRFFLNTTLITVINSVFGIFASALVAYGFVRIPFYGRNVLFVVVLATMMVPPVITMIPTFWLFHKLNWIDTFLPLIVPILCGNPFQIFFFRQVFKTFPEDLFAAATIDGCSQFRMFLHIALPLAKPTIATLALFSFLQFWNDFIGPVLYLQSVEKRTLALGLYSFSGMYATEWHLMMAASVVAVIPVLIMFFALQRYFERGIILSGMKA